MVKFSSWVFKLFMMNINSEKKMTEVSISSYGPSKGVSLHKNNNYYSFKIFPVSDWLKPHA